MFKKFLVFLLCVSFSGCFVTHEEFDKSESLFESDVIKLQLYLATVKKELNDFKEEAKINSHYNRIMAGIDLNTYKNKHINLVKKFKKATIRITSRCNVDGTFGNVYGSGVILKSDGVDTYILTAAHVLGIETPTMRRNKIKINSCTERCVYLSGDVLKKNCIKFSIVISDSFNDFSLIKVNKDLKVSIRVEENLAIGDEVYIVGFPFKPHFPFIDGKKFPVTTITVDKSYIYRKELHSSGEYTGKFYMNVHSNHAISGGPLFNASGDLIGISQIMITAKRDNKLFGANLAGGALVNVKAFFLKNKKYSFIFK